MVSCCASYPGWGGVDVSGGVLTTCSLVTVIYTCSPVKVNTAGAIDNHFVPTVQPPR